MSETEQHDLAWHLEEVLTELGALCLRVAKGNPFLLGTPSKDFAQ